MNSLQVAWMIQTYSVLHSFSEIRSKTKAAGCSLYTFLWLYVNCIHLFSNFPMHALGLRLSPQIFKKVVKSGQKIQIKTLGVYWIVFPTFTWDLNTRRKWPMAGVYLKENMPLSKKKKSLNYLIYNLKRYFIDLLDKRYFIFFNCQIKY